MLITWDYLSTWVANAKCLTPIEKKWTKTACTFLKKVSDSIIERSEKAYITSLQNEAKNSKIIFVDERRKVYQEDYKDAKFIILDDLYELYGCALTNCINCSITEHSECKVYELFMKLGVPPLDEEATGCPFKQTKEWEKLK